MEERMHVNRNRACNCGTPLAGASDAADGGAARRGGVAPRPAPPARWRA